MSSFIANKSNTSSSFTHIYQGISQSDLRALVDKTFLSQGYKRDESAQELIYIKGSRVKRLVLGAFAKYFKYKVLIMPEGENWGVLISSVSTGMSGGLIGINQISNETKQLNWVFTKI